MYFSLIDVLPDHYSFEVEAREISNEQIASLNCSGVSKLLKELRKRENKEYYTPILQKVCSSPTQAWECLKSILSGGGESTLGIYNSRRVLGVLAKTENRNWIERLYDTAGPVELDLEKLNQVLTSYPVGMFINDLYGNIYSVDLLNGHLSVQASENSSRIFIRRRRGFVTGQTSTSEGGIQDASIPEGREASRQAQWEALYRRIRTRNEACSAEEALATYNFVAKVTSGSLSQKVETNDKEAFMNFFKGFTFVDAEKDFKVKFKVNDDATKEKLNTLFSQRRELVFNLSTGLFEYEGSFDINIENTLKGSQLAKIAQEEEQ